MEPDNHPTTVIKALSKPQRRILAETAGNNVSGYYAAIEALHRKGLVVHIDRAGWRSIASLTVLGMVVRDRVREDSANA